MMTSWNRNIFRVTGPLCGEFTGDQWSFRTKASDADLLCFLWSTPEWTFEQTAGVLRRHRVHYDATVMMLTRNVRQWDISILNKLMHFNRSSKELANFIVVTSHGWHVVSIPRLALLCVQQRVQTNKDENIKAVYFVALVFRGCRIHKIP